MLKTLEVRPILRPLDLGDYNDTFRGQVLQVWVNPPRAFIRERDELVGQFTLRNQAAKGKKGRALFAAWLIGFELSMNEWFAKLWSQGEQKESAKEISDLFEKDPALVEWLKRSSIEMLSAHRNAEKKS
jgi:hypothetical protein